jgi:hypothetical protein
MNVIHMILYLIFDMYIEIDDDNMMKNKDYLFMYLFI